MYLPGRLDPLTQQLHIYTKTRGLSTVYGQVTMRNIDGLRIVIYHEAC
jgi:hypothetical protein